MRHIREIVVAAIVLAIVGGGYWLTRGRETAPPSTPPAAAPAEPAPHAAPAATAAPPTQQAQTPTATDTAAKQATVFEFRRLLVNTSGDAPEACFRFSAALDTRAEAHYADYIRIEPSLTPAVRTADADLCLGGLAYGTTYKVTLIKGLPARSGARTAKDETVEVSLGDRPALVALSGDGFILPRAASNGLTVQTVNVDRVRIHVLRMSDRLLPSRIGHRGDGGATLMLSGDQMNRYQIRSLLADSATLIWSGTMAVERDHNRTVQTAFPLSKVIKPGQSGAYLVIAENAIAATPEKFFTNASASDDDSDMSDELWTQIPAHWVIATDLALTAMSGADGLHVFVRSLATAEPLAGIKLTLLATDQDILGDATTAANGEAAFAPGLLRGRGAAGPSSVIAYGPAGDFALLDLGRPAFDLSDRGVTGRPAPGPVEAFLYTERGIYRPGETVEVMTLLRDRVGTAIDAMPVTLVLRRPDGVESKRFTVAAQPQGGMHQAIVLSRTAARGMWSVEARVDPAGSPVGRVQFDVQDFVPQQLKVTVTPVSHVLQPGQRIEATVDGQFLYGAPAAGLKGEAELRIVRDPEPIADAKGYSFGLIDEKVDDTVQKLDMADADSAGHVRIAEPLQPLKPTSAPLKGVLTAGMFEPSGRLVSDQVELPIRNQPLLIGIKPRFADNRVEDGQNAIFDISAFDQTGHAIARAGLHWQLIREDRVYDWFSTNGGGWQWHFHVVDYPLASGSIDVQAASPAVVSQRVDWGYYRLVLTDPATRAATSVRFESGWAATANAADTPDKVEVTVDKASLAPGDTARVRIRGPFAGKAQLTVAGDRIFETRAIAVPKDGTTVEVKAAADWGAGAYVLVSMYRPLNEGRARDPVRAVGLAWLAIDATPRTLKIAIDLPDKVTPRQTIAVPIKVTGAESAGPTYVTLAAVDEGILQLTRFATPDPVAFLFGKRRLGIDIRDDYGRLLDGSADPGAIRAGGDEGIGGQGLPVVSTRTVALFSGPVVLDQNGTARIKLDIPDFEGQLRLMAVAYNHNAVGGGERKLIVRDPVIADLSLPRFLAPDDTARLAILLHNTDGAPGSYHLDLSTDGPVKLAPDHALDYTLAAGERKMDSVAIVGLDDGIGTVKADLAGPGGYRVHREWQIAVRSPHYPIALSQTEVQAPGASFPIDAALLRAFTPGSVTVSVGYAGYAGIDVPSLLQSLYRYPYGCTEQLSSSAFPLVYFNDPNLLGRVPQDQGVKERVQLAVDTILDRQDASGEFGLWRVGDGEASPWLNVYALDFLMHAKGAGFAVPDAALRRGYAWLQLALRRIDQNNGGYYAEGPQATRAYAQYVLARAGRADIGELRRMHDNAVWAVSSSGGITPASVYWQSDRRIDSLAEPLSLGHLAGALSLMGDRARARDTFALAIANLSVGQYPSWWHDYAYYSSVRDLAGLIAIAAEIGEAKTAAALIERFKGLSLSADKLNTQEKAWLLAAAHALGSDDRARSIAVNGKAVTPFKLPMALAPTVAEIEAGYSVVNTGERDLWRTLAIQGAPRIAPSAMAAGFTLSKEYLSLDGKPVDPRHLRQNDRLIVSLQGASQDNDDHRAILVDMLPAGWEIEAVIAKDTEYSFLGPLSKMRVAEARDDRFVAAFDLGAGLVRRNRYSEVQDDKAKRLADGAFHVAYLARVVTPGSFELPEAVMQDMYRPEVMARTAAGRTTDDPR